MSSSFIIVFYEFEDYKPTESIIPTNVRTQESQYITWLDLTSSQEKRMWLTVESYLLL